MISILLASYNGERYIAEQIRSILAQTEQEFVLYINDDCSTDGTYEIEKEFERRFPEKICVTRNASNSGSAKFNFMKLMADHRDDYIMLCDQDDIWLPEKIEISLKKIRTVEEQRGKETPILIHTDLTVVDEGLNVIDPSFKHMMCGDYDKTKLNNLLIQNIVTGCTTIYNRALADLIRPTDGFMVMHDWWLALIASAFGVIDHCDDQTILYRQHGDNSVGVRKMRSLKFIAQYMVKVDKIKTALKVTYAQAETFLAVYADVLNADDARLIQEYCEIPEKNKISRLRTVFKLNTLKSGLLRNIGYVIYL